MWVQMHVGVCGGECTWVGVGVNARGCVWVNACMCVCVGLCRCAYMPHIVVYLVVMVTHSFAYCCAVYRSGRHGEGSRVPG